MNIHNHSVEIETSRKRMKRERLKNRITVASAYCAYWMHRQFSTNQSRESDSIRLSSRQVYLNMEPLSRPIVDFVHYVFFSHGVWGDVTDFNNLIKIIFLKDYENTYTVLSVQTQVGGICTNILANCQSSAHESFMVEFILIRVFVNFSKTHDGVMAGANRILDLVLKSIVPVHSVNIGLSFIGHSLGGLYNKVVVLKIIEFYSKNNKIFINDSLIRLINLISIATPHYGGLEFNLFLRMGGKVFVGEETCNDIFNICEELPLLFEEKNLILLSGDLIENNLIYGNIANDILVSQKSSLHNISPSTEKIKQCKSSIGIPIQIQNEGNLKIFAVYFKQPWWDLCQDAHVQIIGKVRHLRHTNGQGLLNHLQSEFVFI